MLVMVPAMQLTMVLAMVLALVLMLVLVLAMTLVLLVLALVLAMVLVLLPQPQLRLSMRNILTAATKNQIMTRPTSIAAVALAPNVSAARDAP
jgi:hypothetical protein